MQSRMLSEWFGSMADRIITTDMFPKERILSYVTKRIFNAYTFTAAIIEKEVKAEFKTKMFHQTAVLIPKLHCKDIHSVYS